MRSRYRIHDKYSTYFVTSTIVEWLPVLTTTARCEIVVDSLRYCREHKDLKIYA